MKAVAFRFVTMPLLCLVATLAPAQSTAQQPLSIGSTKQLLLDDFIVEASDGLTRVLHQPERYSGNPIIVGDTPWEKWQASVDGRPVIYDQRTREFKMYYVSALREEGAPTGFRYKTCYATSKDGLQWTKPVLNQVEWEGSRKNNILKWGENWMRRPNVIEDLNDPDPERLFKMTYTDIIGGRSAVTKAYSRDGITWRLNADGKPWFRGPKFPHNANLLGWDPGIQQYVLYIRMPGKPNSIGRSTSPDFVTWTEPVAVLAPVADEVGVDFKGNAAFLYENVYIGLLWVFRRTENDWPSDGELVFSRDGIKWERLFPRNYFFPHGQPGTWDSEGVLPHAPVIYRDKLWFYYSGWNLPYGDHKATERSEAGWIENGQRMQHASGVATLRLDGFVSFDAGQQRGMLTTKLFELPGGALTVNAAVRGELRVELLDERGQVVPGYSAKDSVPIRTDGLRHAVRWEGKGNNIEKLWGRSIKLRFLLREGSLYAFRFGS